MKKKKPQHRIPWFCFDVPYDKPPTKGWWKNGKDKMNVIFGNVLYKRMKNDRIT